MKILDYFEQRTTQYNLLTLKDSDRDAFLSILPPEYRISYISDDDLQKRIDSFSSTKEIELSEILPDKGNIKAGDFGEILSYFIFKERHKNRKVDGPRKWRWKQEKNVAAPYTDVILFSISKPGKASKEDLLISVESKMKATANKDYHAIQDAINGAEKDYVTRIASTLSWLRKKYKEDSLKKGARVDDLKKIIASINRFIKSETLGEYQKKIKAIAFIDSKFFDEEIKKMVKKPTITGMDLTIFAVSLKDLKKVYEKVYNEIPKL